MHVNELKRIKNKIKDVEQKHDAIILIEKFLKDLKESKVLDLYTQWGSAPSHTNLSNFNDVKIGKFEIYQLIGSEIEDLLENKLKQIDAEIENIKLEDLIS